MSDTQKRQPKGIPTGGEFAGNEHDEAAMGLPEDDYVYEPYNPTYTVLSHNIGVFKDRIDRANNRLARAGVDERFSYTTEERIIERDGVFVEVVDVTLEKPRISMGEWRFDSTHELTQNGDVLNYYSVEDADRSDVTDMGCEHCGVKRHRGKVYRVSNKDTGEVKQIGGSCLEIFTGVKPSGLWALTYDPDVEDLGYNEDDDLRFGGFGNSQSLVVDDRNMLLATIRASAQSDRGFISKASAGFNETPTSEVVKGKFAELTAEAPSDAEVAEIDAVLAYVRESEDDSEYMDNLRTVLKPSADGTSYIKSKHIGIAASAVGSYRRHIEREKERAEKAKMEGVKRQSFIAPPGTKIADYKKKNGALVARILRVTPGRENDYGAIPDHINMMTEDGHVIYWKASNTTPFEAGDVVSIDGGSVKDNKVSDYNGDYETVITRAKLTVIPQEENQ